jgi:hypothetical protein
MRVPNVPAMDLIDSTGQMSSEWLNFFSQLVTELQLNFGTEALKPPQLTSVQIADLATIAAMNPENAAKSNGEIFFDVTTSDATSMKALIDGSLYTFTLT